ncbi:MAG: DUF4055 domain-containing protein [Porticoccaceae bacterium]
MPVTTIHPEYSAHLPLWRMIDQALDGEGSVKADSANLPKTSGMIEAERQNAENSYLYQAYVTRAQYEGWVGDSLRTMMGLVARLTPEVELPPALAGLEDSVTNDGYGLRQLFLRVCRQTIAYGRSPLLANVDDSGRPYIDLYRPQSAINWKTASVGGRDDLVLAVLVESRPGPGADEYAHDAQTVYRVFRLADGFCASVVLDENGDTVEPERILGRVDSRGNVLSGVGFIPLVFSGSTDNTPGVDEIPMLTMARAALKNYQLSADYFGALHQTSHPQPWVSGIDESHSLTVTGPSAAWDLGPTGQCGYLEFAGAGIEALRQAMADQKNAALEAGAKVMDVTGTESGEARRARQNDQHATLHSIVMTAAEGVEQALKYCAEWVGADSKAVRFSVKPDFTSGQVDALILAQLQTAVVAGGVSWQSYWQYLTTGKLPDRSYEDEREAVGNDGPALGDL